MIHKFSRYLLTLVALFAMTTGAWATDDVLLTTIESKNYTSFTSGSMTFDDKVTVTFSGEVSNSGDEYGWYSLFGVTLTVTPVEGITITRVKFYTFYNSAFDEAAPFEAVLGEGDPWFNAYMFVNGNSYGEYGVTKIEVYGTAPAAAPDVEVTTNAASEGATFTEAWFQMPAFDATADYELVRDMSVQMTAQVGDGNDGYRIRLKKNPQSGKFEPADMTPQAMAGLIAVTDDIEEKTLTNMTDYTISIFAVDEQGEPTGDAIAFANLVPGRYVAIATAADGSAYDGATEQSNVFVLFQGYEVEIAAGEYVTYYKEENLYVEDEDAELYTITSVGSETATAAPLTVAKAYTPILVKNKGAEKKVILLIPTETEGDEVDYAPEFIGTLEATTIAASSENQNNYAFNGLQFVWVKNAVEIGANKAWLSINTGVPSARGITLVFDETTKIANTNITNITNGNWYDLNGRKLNAMPTKKGVYIMNGRKVVVK